MFKKVSIALALAAVIIVSAASPAKATTADRDVSAGATLGVVGLDMAIATTHAVGPAVGSAATFATSGFVLPIAAGYTILTQKDQYDEPVYHRLACALFGDEGRVGNETDSACKHIE